MFSPLKTLHQFFFHVPFFWNYFFTIKIRNFELIRTTCRIVDAIVRDKQSNPILHEFWSTTFEEPNEDVFEL